VNPAAMKNPKDLATRAAEAAEMGRQLQTVGIPEDDPDFKKLLKIIDEFVTKGYGYSGFVKTQLGFDFDVKFSMQKHITSYIRIAKPAGVAKKHAGD
jgi:hypothetical protein